MGELTISDLKHKPEIKKEQFKLVRRIYFGSYGSLEKEIEALSSHIRQHNVFEYWKDDV